MKRRGADQVLVLPVRNDPCHVRPLVDEHIRDVEQHVFQRGVGGKTFKDP